MASPLRDALRSIEQVQAQRAAGAITPLQMSSDMRRIKAEYQKQVQTTQSNLKFLTDQQSTNRQLAQTQRQLLATARTARSRGLFGVGRNIGGSLQATPRQVIAATQGNIANTGRNIGLGVVAAGVGLAAAGSPSGIDVLWKPIKAVASVIGGTLLPALVSLGTAINAFSMYLRHQAGLKEGGVLRSITRPLGAPVIKTNAGLWNMILNAGDSALNPGKHADRFMEGWNDAAENIRKFDAESRAKPFDWNKALAESRTMILQNMMQAMGPTVKHGGIADAAKRVQESAFGDPFERQALEIWRENLGQLKNGNETLQRVMTALGIGV
jgi:hypothetical protein